MTSTRKTALAVGVLFLLTFITSIGAVFAYGPILSDANYITGSGSDTRVFLGAFLELVLIVTNISCAVVLFPLLKRQNEGLALAYVAERIVEATFILIGLLSLLAIVTLRQTAAGADAGILVTIGRTLRGIHDWTFLLGPSFADGIGTGAIRATDVPVRPGRQAHGAVRPRRRSPPRCRRGRRAARGHPAGFHDPGHRDRSRSSSGSCSWACT